MPGQQVNRQTLLMRWFNSMGTILSICNLLLMVMGVQLVVVSFVNDFNSDIISDVNYHFHYGLSFAGLILMVSALIGFAGFLKESLPNINLSWALMIFVLILLCQSVTFMWLYERDLSLLINSEAEISFIQYFNEMNKMSKFSNHTSNFKRKTQETMKRYQCCGWDSMEQMIFDHRFKHRTGLYPCECCSKDIEFVKHCEQYSDSIDSMYVCNRTENNYFVDRVCRDVMNEVFRKDLNTMTIFIVIVLLLTVISIFISVQLSTSLLDLYNASD